MADITDATFEAAVLERSQQVPVVVDLWAPWCGPCQALGPMLERAVAATAGAVELAKVNVDESPGVAAAFAVQSIPAVFALRSGQVVDSFVGARPEEAVAEFVSRLVPASSEADRLADKGDQASLRQALALEPDHPGAVLALAQMLAAQEPEEALALLARVPETAETRRIAAGARLAAGGISQDGLEARLDRLLERVRDDQASRQEFVDLLETMGSDDPRTARYRRALTARLF